MPGCSYHAALCARCSRSRAGRRGEEGIEENSMQCVCAMILNSTDIHDAFRLSMRLEGAGETRQVQLGNEERGAKRKKQRQKRDVLRQKLTGRMRELGCCNFLSFLNIPIHSLNIITARGLVAEVWSIEDSRWSRSPFCQRPNGRRTRRRVVCSFDCINITHEHGKLGTLRSSEDRLAHSGGSG